MSPSFQLLVTEQAADQIRNAGNWWADNRADVPSRLGEELERGFRLLVFQPLAGHLVPDAKAPEVRRILLRKTQHHVYYRVDTDPGAVVILAFWSVRQGTLPDV